MYKLWMWILLVIGHASVAAACDQLWVHGHIYTANPRAPWAEAICITGSRIVAIGKEADVPAGERSHAKVTDLKGATVIPGIVDSHAHVVFGALELHGFNLSTPELSITPDEPDQLIRAIKTYAGAHPHDAVLIGRADFSSVPPTTPRSELLDQAVSDRPIVIHNTSEHAVWLNSAALKIAGIGDEPVADPDEERGVIRDASGHPQGVLLEAAMELAGRAVAARIPLEEKLAMLRAATAHLNSYGITMVVNATGNLDEIRLFAALRDRNQLTVRTRTAFGAVAVRHHLTPQFLADLEQARSSYHDEWVSANLVKFFADGSTGLIPPLVYQAHEYETLVRELDRRGYQIMTHAQRSDSVHMILDTYERVAHDNGPRDRRMRIEHVFVLEPRDIQRFGQLSVIAAMQPTFCCTETGGMSYDPADHNPTDRWRSLKDTGATLAFGSDWPCTWPPDPFIAMEEAVTRETWHSESTRNVAGQPFDGAAQGGAKPTGGTYEVKEAIGVEDAVNAYTRDSAYTAFADGYAGTLEVGKSADLAVLSQDLFAVPHPAISKTQVVLTMVGGKVVFRR